MNIKEQDKENITGKIEYMIKKIKNIFNSIKEHFNKILDIAVLKEENKLLRKQLEEEKKKNQPLIDLKNRYLSELRVKNLELGRLKKKVGANEKDFNNNFNDNINTNTTSQDIH